MVIGWLDCWLGLLRFTCLIVMIGSVSDLSLLIFRNALNERLLDVFLGGVSCLGMLKVDATICELGFSFC
jgi:hypothetical protein